MLGFEGTSSDFGNRVQMSFGSAALRYPENCSDCSKTYLVQPLIVLIGLLTSLNKLIQRNHEIQDFLVTNGHLIGSMPIFWSVHCALCTVHCALCTVPNFYCTSRIPLAFQLLSWLKIVRSGENLAKISLNDFRHGRLAISRSCLDNSRVIPVESTNRTKLRHSR
jgi:hypothetical protein